MGVRMAVFRVHPVPGSEWWRYSTLFQDEPVTVLQSRGPVPKRFAFLCWTFVIFMEIRNFACTWGSRKANQPGIAQGFSLARLSLPCGAPVIILHDSYSAAVEQYRLSGQIGGELDVRIVIILGQHGCPDWDVPHTSGPWMWMVEILRILFKMRRQRFCNQVVWLIPEKFAFLC